MSGREIPTETMLKLEKAGLFEREPGAFRDGMPIFSLTQYAMQLGKEGFQAAFTKAMREDVDNDTEGKT